MIYTKLDPGEFLREQGWPFKEKSGQFILDCPFCSKKGHFYMNSSDGRFDCKSCGKSGNLLTLKKELGIELTPLVKPKSTPSVQLTWEGYQTCIDNLWEHEDALKYLHKDKGLTLETIRNERLGFKKKCLPKYGGDTFWITIPHVQNGELVNIKYRSLPPAKKTFRRVEGCPSILFNQDSLRDFAGTEIILVEGELDAITLIQYGFKNVASTTTGAGGFDPHWYDFIRSLHPATIFVVYDADIVGQKHAKDLISRFGADLCRNVILPDAKDANEYFWDAENNIQKHTAEDFRALLEEADKVGVEHVIHGVSALDELRDRYLYANDDPSLNGIETPWSNVNKIIDHSMKQGELITVSANPGVGKTTWVLNILFEAAKKMAPALLMCLEMRPEVLIKKLVCYASNVGWDNVGVKEIDGVYQLFQNIPLYLSYPTKPNLTMEDVETIFTSARKRYGIQIAAFDNLQFLIREIKFEAQQTAVISKQFKCLFETLEIPGILISQPRKTENELISVQDLKGSSAMHADSDKIVLLHRLPMKAPNSSGGSKRDEIPVAPLEATLHPITIVEAGKGRFSQGGTTFLYMEGDKSRFRLPARGELDEFRMLYSKKAKSRGDY